jgi:hypothetical protein
MKTLKINALILLSLLIITVGCKNDLEFAKPPIAISFGTAKASIEIDPNSPIYEIEIQANAAVKEETQIPFTIVHDTLDGLDNTVPSGFYSLETNHVTISAGNTKGSATIKFVADSLDYIEKGLKFTLQNGNYITNTTRNNFRLSVTKLCPYNKVILTITTDGFPEDTSYELYAITEESKEELLQKGGPYFGDEFKQTEIPITFCLISGKYALKIYDSYGDGINDGGYSITSNGIELVSNTVSSSSVTSYFDIP